MGSPSEKPTKPSTGKLTRGFSKRDRDTLDGFQGTPKGKEHERANVRSSILRNAPGKSTTAFWAIMDFCRHFVHLSASFYESSQGLKALRATRHSFFSYLFPVPDPRCKLTYGNPLIRFPFSLYRLALDPQGPLGTPFPTTYLLANQKFKREVEKQASSIFSRIYVYFPCWF